MSSFAFGLLSAAPTIVTGITSLVHGIEHLFGKGNGQAKKAAVISAFQGGIQAYSSVAGALTGAKLPQVTEASQKSFENLVDAIVAFYNELGIFQHGGK